MRKLLFFLGAIFFVIQGWGQSAATLPYLTDFETATDNSKWIISNSTCVNKWIFGTGVSSAGFSGNSLFISNNSSSNTYSVDNASVVTATRQIVSNGSVMYQLSFDFNCQGEGNMDYLKVYIVPKDTVYTGNFSSISPPTFPYYAVYNYISPNLIAKNGTNNFLNFMSGRFYYNISDTLMGNAGDTVNLIFVWKNNQNTGTQSPAAIDNIALVGTSCESVAGFDVPISSITSNTAMVNWVNNPSHLYYTLEYKIDTQSWSSATQIQNATSGIILSYLIPSLKYNIRIKASCGNEESFWKELSFNTACDAITTFPWTEGFENPNWLAPVLPGNASSPRCWLNLNGKTTAGLWRYTNTATYVRSGGGAAQMYGSASAQTTQHGDYLLTPIFTFTGNQSLSFWAKGDKSYNDTLKVMIYNVDSIGNDILSLADTITFKTILPDFCVPKFSFAKYEVDLSSYVGRYRIAFVHDTKGGYYMGLDDISITNIPQCRAPYNVSTNSPSSTSVNVIFNPAGASYLDWYVYYKPSANLRYDSVLVNSSNYVLNNLRPSTTYDLFVKTMCNGSLSEGSFPIQFSTNCGVIADFPWNEGFESLWTSKTLSTGDTLAPYCWININGSYKSGFWKPMYTSQYIHSGVASASMMTGNTGASILHNDWLITPTFSLNGNQVLRFWAKGYSSSYKDSLEVKVFNATTMQRDVQISDTVGSAFVTIMQKTMLSPSDFVQYELDLSPFTGNCRIAFVKNHLGGYYVNLDDVKIADNPGCKRPTALRDTLLSPSSASIIFTPANVTDNSWVVYYNNTSTLSWDSLVVSSNLFTIQNLNPGELYQYYLKTNCPSGLSEESEISTFRTECNPIISMPYFESFDGYGAGSYSNWNYCWYRKSTYSAGTTTFYPYIYGSQSYSSPGSIFFNANASTTGNYYNLVTTPKIDSNYAPIRTLRLKFKTLTQTSSSPGIEIGVMTDPRDSASFVKEGSNIMFSTLSTWESKEVSFASYTGKGQYIAFRCQAGTSPNSFYIDDLLIEYLPQCAAPNNLVSSKVYHNSASVSWSKANNSDSTWWIYYKPLTATNFDSVYTNTRPTTLKNLLPSTAYQFKVRTACGVDFSDTSASAYFTTKCYPISIPYVNSFDSYGYGIGVMPTCWTINSNVSTNYPYLYDYVKYSAPASLYFNASSGNYTLTSMPAIDSSININTLAAKFKIRIANAIYDGIKVGVMSDPDDISTFVPMGGYVKSATTTAFDSVEVSFLSYTGNGHYIAFLCEGVGKTNGFYLDDLIIDSIPACAKARNIFVSAITPNNAKINWGKGNLNNNAWLLYYRSVGSPSFDSLMVYDSTNYILNNLSSATKYEYYLKTSCGNDFSDPTSIYSFYTSCPAISSFPWNEDFENTWVATSMVNSDLAPMNCWININEGASKSYLWQKTQSIGIPTYQRTGTGSAQLLAYNNPMGDYLISPVLTLSGNQKLVFWGKGYSTTASYPENLWVKAYNVTTNGDISSVNDTTKFIDLGFINDTNQFTWKEYEFLMTGLSGNYRLVFSRNNNVGYNYFIDDLKVDNIPPCSRPKSVSVSGIQAHQSNISWINGTLTDNEWVIYYRPFGTQNWDSVISTSNPYILTSLVSNTEYEIEVKTVCSLGVYSDARTGGRFITTCDPTVTFPYYEGFESAWSPAYEISNEARPNNCWININGGESMLQKWQKNSSIGIAYVKTGSGSLQLAASNTNMGDYILSPTMTLNGNQKIVFWAKGYSSGNYPENIWIKVYNETLNGAFDSYSDTTLMTNLAFINDTNKYTWQEYEFPLTGLTGNYRIVFARNNNVGYNFYIDDFIVDDLSACPRPSNVIVSNIQQTQADVTWTPGTIFDNAWVINYRSVGSTKWDSVYTNSNPHILSGLSSSSAYEIQVKTDCGAGAFSDYRQGSVFKTSCGAISTLPWGENFDSYTTTGTTVIPYCWTRNSTYASRPYVNSGGFTGNSLYFYSSASTYSMIITPEFASNIPLNSMKLDFKFKASTANIDTIRIGTMVDTTASSWVEFAMFTGPSNSWKDIQVNFNNYVGIGKFIAFRCDNGTAYLDDILFSSNFVCSDPTTLSVSNISQTAATISWTPGANETNWEIKLDSLGAPIALTNTTYTFTGLTHNTPYKAYLRSNCTGGFYSNWVPISFTTQVMPSNPIVSTSSVTTLTYSTATLGGSYIQWLDTVKTVGFEYKTNAAKSWTIQSVSPVTSPFSYNATGLTPSTTYKVRAYATTNAGTFYGDTVSFITAAFNAPIVTTDSLKVYYGNTTAKFYGTISSGTESILARGFEYKTASQDWSLAQELTATGTTSITANATGLVSGANYNVRAYAETQSGKTYGAEINFNATSGLEDIDINTMTVSLYPNPASTTSTLVVKGIVGEAKVIITDVQGRTINTFTMKSINGEATQEIKVNGLAKGVYYIRIQNANTISTQKLIIR